MVRVTGRVGHGFVDAGEVVAVKYHARRAGVDEACHSASAAGIDDVGGARDVGAVVISVGSPRRRLGGRVVDHVRSATGLLDGPGVGDVALGLLHREQRQRRVRATGKTAHPVPAGGEAAHDGRAEEAAATGDERAFRVHVALRPWCASVLRGRRMPLGLTCFCTQTANCSRKIFAL